jgi:hypothetical protein
MGSVRFSTLDSGQEVVMVKVTRKLGRRLQHLPEATLMVVMAQADRQLLLVERHRGSRLAEQIVGASNATVHMRCLGCSRTFANGRPWLVSTARKAVAAGRSDVALLPGENSGLAAAVA